MSEQSLPLESLPNRRPSLMRSLAWKDAKMIVPLTVAIVIAVVVFNIVGLGASLLADLSSQNRLVASTMICCLLSYLFALGVAPTLVGNEEEAGTLAWLRTLPVGWASVTLSKLWVSVAGLMLVWFVGGILLLLQFLIIANGPKETWVDDLLSPTGAEIVQASVAVAVSFLILAISFACSFLFRSPMAAVVAFFPAFVVIMLGIGFVNEQMLKVGFGISYGRFVNFTPSVQAAMVAVPMLAFAGLIGLIYWLAWQRLRGQGRYEYWTARSQAAFQLHEAPVSMRLQRPSINGALFWQQIRHIGPFAVALLIISLGYCLFASWNMSHSINQTRVLGLAFGSIVIGLSATWIGGLTFFSDNVRRRIAFFADRGVSPSRFWCTRVAVSGAFLLLLIGCVAIGFWMNEDKTSGLSLRVIAIVLSIAWSQSVLISMVVNRPILGLFGAVVLWAIWPISVGWFYAIYQDYFWTLGFAVPVLLFASWRLCRFWMNGETGKKFQARRIAYLALALGLPMFITLGHRYVTLPATDSVWRNQMRNQDLPAPKELLAKTSWMPWSSAVSIDALSPLSRFGRKFTPANYVGGLANEEQEKELLNRIDQEMAEQETIGDHVSWAELSQVLVGSTQATPWISQWHASPNRWIEIAAQDMLSYDPSEVQIKSVEVLLVWSTRARQMIVRGDEGIETLLRVAEPSEQLAVLSMLWWNESPETAVEIERLRELLPTDQLRRESRRIAIIDHWQTFDRQPWDFDSGAVKSFAGDTMLTRQTGWLRIEQIRSERMVDQAIRDLLYRIESASHLASDSEAVWFTHRWEQAMFGPLDGKEASRITNVSRSSTMIPWVQSLNDHEQRINALYRR